MRIRMIGLLMLCVLLASGLPLTARAQQIMDKKELKATLKRAEAGDVDAMLSVASYYDVQKDQKKAFKWAKMAVEKGQLDELGPQLDRVMGHGYRWIEKDRYDKALEWYLKHPEGNYLEIGRLYASEGNGVKQDLLKALEYYDKEEARYQQMRQAGERIDKYTYDFLQNLKDFALLQIRYNQPELYKKVMAERSGQAARPAQASAAQASATATQQSAPQQQLTPEQEAAANNNATYCYNRGSYFCNRANPRDYRAAVAWLKRAYELGNQDACYDLGLCYSLTDSPLLDRETAHMWFGRGLAHIGDNNYWRCCYQLGFDFKAGRGVEQNYDSAIYFFEQALKYNPVVGNVSTIRNLISQCRQEMNAGSRQSTASSGSQQNRQAGGGGSTAFPDGQHFYYQTGSGVDLLHIDFYTDKTDGDRLCHVMQNGVLTFYEMTGVSSDGMEFRGVQFQPEYKMMNYAWGSSPQLTGRILNVDTGQRMTVAPGYGRVTLNGKTYDHPLSRDAYNRIYDQVFGDGTAVPVTGGAGGGSVSAPGGQVQSGMSASYYQETYNRWARVAESAYRSLTSTGLSVHDRTTDEHAGSALGTWQGSNYATMKSELRQAQNAMRDVRNEARRNGITIQQSTWETATVGY